MECFWMNSSWCNLSCNLHMEKHFWFTKKTEENWKKKNTENRFQLCNRGGASVCFPAMCYQFAICDVFYNDNE